MRAKTNVLPNTFGAQNRCTGLNRLKDLQLSLPVTLPTCEFCGKVCGRI